MSTGSVRSLLVFVSNKYDGTFFQTQQLPGKSLGSEVCYYFKDKAGVAEWYTRMTQNRVSQDMRVRVPPPA